MKKSKNIILMAKQIECQLKHKHSLEFDSKNEISDQNAFEMQKIEKLIPSSIDDRRKCIRIYVNARMCLCAFSVCLSFTLSFSLSLCVHEFSKHGCVAL